MGFLEKIFGKLLNCGQTCVVPDYILAHSSIRGALIEKLKSEIIRQYGENILTNPAYGHIINEKHFDRIIHLIHPDKIVFGWTFDKQSCKISPTILDSVTFDDVVMNEEIFDPILPVLSVNSADQAVSIINHQDKPLVLYVFFEDKKYIQPFDQTVCIWWRVY